MDRIQDIFNYDVVIFDEWVSILTHISPKGLDDTYGTYEWKIKIILDILEQRDTQWIFLDSFLTDRDVDIVKSFSPNPTFVVNNIYKPYVNNNVNVYEFSPKS